MKSNSTVFQPGHGDSHISYDGIIEVEDWTGLDLPHIKVRVNGEGGYYTATIDLSRAETDGWIFVENKK